MLKQQASNRARRAATKDDVPVKERPYGPHQLAQSTPPMTLGAEREVPDTLRPVFETVLGALGGKLKKGEEFMSAPHVERVIGELVAAGKMDKHFVPVMKTFAVTAHDMVARPEFLEKSKDLAKAKGLDERNLQIDEGATSPLKPEKAIVENVLRGEYTGKKQPLPRYETSLPPKMADFVSAVLGGEVGKKFADQSIKRQAMAGSIPVTYGRREVRDAPLTRMAAQGKAQDIIAQLHPDDQQILKLAFRHNQNIYDIAEQMNLNPGEVSKRLEAAKKKVGKLYQEKIISPKQAARTREKRAGKVQTVAQRGATTAQKIEERKKAEESEPYKRVGEMEASPKVATVDPKVKPFKMPVTSTGKPLDYMDKKTGRPKYYTAAQLEKIYNEKSARKGEPLSLAERRPVLGQGAPQVSQTKVALWNKLAREGNVTAAIKLARWKNGQYGKRMAQVGEMKVQMKKDWRTKEWVPKTRVNPKTGKQEPVEKFETPRIKALKRNRNSARDLGVTGSEVARMSEAGKLQSEKANTEQVKGKNPLDVLRRRFAETKFRKGYHGPFEKKTEEQVKKLAAETTEEEMSASLAPKIRRKLRSGIQGPLEARDENRVRNLAMKLLRKKIGKIEESSRTSGNRGIDASGNKTGTGIHGDIVAMSRKMEDSGAEEDANIRRIEGETTKRSKVVARLLRIRKALGKPQYDKPIGPELPSRPRVINEVNAAAEEAPELPKARKKPIHKRPGRGPGIKEALFSMLAKAGARR
jgi:hypothetical protein